MSFSAGDVVQLKSGGPMMTIGTVNDKDQTAVCLWFDEANLKRETLPLMALDHSELYTDEDEEELEDDEEIED